MIRSTRVAPALVLLGAAVTGCGGGATPTPVELTPEFLEQAKTQEKQAADEEKLQQKLGFRDTPEDPVQKQVDLEERAERQKQLSTAGGK